MYKSITLTTYMEHASAREVPALLRDVESFFTSQVLPRLEEAGYTSPGRMNANSGIGEKNPSDPVYGILILSWKLEKMTDDHLVTLVEQAFGGLGSGPVRW